MQGSHRKAVSGINLLAVFVLGILSVSHAAQAQAFAGASKKADLAFFGGYTRGNEDYGPKDSSGITAGLDYTRFYGWRVDPSFEVRAAYNSDYIFSQKSILAGLRLTANFHRFHPYADALFGGNRINYKILPDPGNPYYNYDIAFTTSYGGGVDIDLVRNIQAKVDFQAQSSNYGVNGIVPNAGEFTLSPTFLTVGAVYHLGGRRR